jgi:hypothetical protein
MSELNNMDNIYARRLTRGNYDTDFSNLREGKQFPSNEVRDRAKVYRLNKKLYSGEYAYNRNLIAMIDEVQQEIPYPCPPINRFELVVNKMDSILFGNELTIQTGDVYRDKEVQKLIERTGWVKSIREGVKLAQIYGDAVLKTGRNGVSSFSPLFAYKVVDESDKKNVKGYVLHEIIYGHKDVKGYTNVDRYKPTHLRIIISCKGFEFERIFEYKGSNKLGTLGKPVEYKYKDRVIPAEGKYYWTDIEDCETVQWLSINPGKDDVYGSSAFDNIRDLVLLYESRLATENWILDNHGKPILLLGMSAFTSNEKTGSYSPAVIEGKYMINRGTGEKAEYLTWDGKLDNSRALREDIEDIMYELTEMSKTFMSGSFSGNVSEESLNNMIKSVIDRGNRDLNDIWYDIRKSLYVLCKLNGIEISIEDININFNVGRVDDTKAISEICKTLSDIKLFSRQTLLNKFFGYTEDDALAEFERIQKESENNSTIID